MCVRTARQFKTTQINREREEGGGRGMDAWAH